MNWTTLGLFFASSWLLILTPGPDMLYVITRGLAQGRRAGIISALGVASGILVHTILAVLGLAIVLRTSAVAFALVKYAGSCYLIYLGIRTICSRDPIQPTPDSPPVPTRTIFMQGMLTNVLNPKIALFFLAFLPQFVVAEHLAATTQMLLLGICYALCSTLFLMLVSLCSGSLGTFFGKSINLSRVLGKISGGVFITLGLKLFFTKQPGLS